MPVTDLAAIETAIVARLQAIQTGGGALFASTRGFSTTNSREVVTALRRELKPAALVVFGGRAASGDWGIPRDPVFSIFAIAESLRGGDEPRLGSALVAGGFDLLSEMFAALAGLMIPSERRLSLADERLVAADDTSVVFEQRYDVVYRPAVAVPTFHGAPICGPDSNVTTQVEGPAVQEQRFAFPGIDGEFRMVLGRRARGIEWQGQLRAVGHDALDAIETQLEQHIADGVPGELIDEMGRSFANCAARQLRHLGSRRRHPLSGQILQDFSLSFIQMVY